MISDLILPVAVTPFDERLPNLAELSEPQVNRTTLSGELTFRSPSQAVAKYFTGPLSGYACYELVPWRELPLHSVRRLTVKIDLPPLDRELKWLSSLLRDLKLLEHLDIRSECRLARWLRHKMARGTTSFHFRTLITRWGEHGPGAYDKGEAETDTDSSSDVGIRTMVRGEDEDTDGMDVGELVGSANSESGSNEDATDIANQG